MTIAKEHQDKNLFRKLQGEKSGILSWIVKGCLNWQRSGLQYPAAVQEATQEYRQDSDPLGDFLSGRCILLSNLSCSAGALFTEYNPLLRGEWNPAPQSNPVRRATSGTRLQQEAERLRDSICWRGDCRRYAGGIMSLVCRVVYGLPELSLEVLTMECSCKPYTTLHDAGIEFMKGPQIAEKIPARWPALLSDHEAGEYLGVSRSLIREWLDAGHISRCLCLIPAATATSTEC